MSVANTLPEQMPNDREPYYILDLPSSQPSLAIDSGFGIAGNAQIYPNSARKRKHKKAKEQNFP